MKYKITTTIMKFLIKIYFYLKIIHYLLQQTFSTKNWLPTKNQQNKINNFLEINKNINTVFLFSHQIFWQLDVDNEIQPNGMDLLEDNLIRNSTKWLNLDEKKLIVISGDYGANSQQSYCKKLGNTIFVANGIGDKKNDTILQIYMNDKASIY